jgi:hypothetical protein
MQAALPIWILLHQSCGYVEVLLSVTTNCCVFQICEPKYDDHHRLKFRMRAEGFDARATTPLTGHSAVMIYLRACFEINLKQAFLTMRPRGNQI